MFRKGNRVALALAAAALAVAAGCGGDDDEDSGGGGDQAAQGGRRGRVRRCRRRPRCCSIRALVAEELGFFEEENVQPELAPAAEEIAATAFLDNGDADVARSPTWTRSSSRVPRAGSIR